MYIQIPQDPIDQNFLHAKVRCPLASFFKRPRLVPVVPIIPVHGEGFDSP